MGRHRSTTSRKNKKDQSVSGRLFARARLFWLIERIVVAFVPPAFFLGLFFSGFWQGLFAPYYPWLHFIALFVFTGWFLFALSGIQRAPANPTPTSLLLLTKAILYSRKKNHDFHSPRRAAILRRSIAIGIFVAAFLGWLAIGDPLLKRIDPNFGKGLEEENVLMNIWITPASYTKKPVLIIASPEGIEHDDETLEIPFGSKVTARFSEKGRRPVLQANGTSLPLKDDGVNGFSITETLEKGDYIALSQGWKSLGFWRTKIIRDEAPRVDFTQFPSEQDDRGIHFAYNAHDDYEVESVSLIVTPLDQQNESLEPISVTLLAAPSKDIVEDATQDLSSSRFAGSPVTLHLRVEDSLGQKGESQKISFTLPERAFTHPFARALGEGRHQLLLGNLDDGEIAGLLVGISRRFDVYRNDPVVLMSLRSAALRLMLDQSIQAREAVADTMWQAAVRIEEGPLGVKREAVRQQEDDLARLLHKDGNAAAIQDRINALEDSLMRYVSEIAASITLEPIEKKDSTLPEAWQKALMELRGKIAGGDIGGARQALAHLRLMAEKVKIESLSISASQKEMAQRFGSLKRILQMEQAVAEETIRIAETHRAPEAIQKLAAKQLQIYKKLKDLSSRFANVPQSLTISLRSMSDAANLLKNKEINIAMEAEAEALDALRQAMVDILGIFPTSEAPRSPPPSGSFLFH